MPRDPHALSRQEFLHALVLAGPAAALPRPEPPQQPALGTVQVLNARDGYGALGDGQTDDTVPLQRAINDAARLGLNVYLPAGRYRIRRLLFHYDPVRNPGFPQVPGREGNFAFFGDGAVTRASLVNDQLPRTVLESDALEPPLELDGSVSSDRLRAVSLARMTIRAANGTAVLRLARANTFLNLEDLLIHQRGPGGGILAEDTWVNAWANVYVLGEVNHLGAPTSRGLVLRNVSTGAGNLVLTNVSTDRFRVGWEIGNSDHTAPAQILSCVTCLGCQATRSGSVGVLVGKGARSFNWIGSHVEQATDPRGGAVGMLVKNFAQGVNVLGSFFSANDTALQVGDAGSGPAESTARQVTVQGSSFVRCLVNGIRVRGTALGGRTTIESNSLTAEPGRLGTTGIALDDADLGGVTLRYNAMPAGGPAAFGADIAHRERADLVHEPGALSFHAASPRLDGTWNGSHLILGEHHLWVDGASRLRIKKGAPAGEEDGDLA